MQTTSFCQALPACNSTRPVYNTYSILHLKFQSSQITTMTSPGLLSYITAFTHWVVLPINTKLIICRHAISGVPLTRTNSGVYAWPPLFTSCNGFFFGPWSREERREDDIQLRPMARLEPGIEMCTMHYGIPRTAKDTLGPPNSSKESCIFLATFWGVFEMGQSVMYVPRNEKMRRIRWSSQ